MNVWITDSVSLIRDIAVFLTSTPIFYVVGTFLLIPIVKLFKGLVGG